jgi:alpha-ribazole phosphatase
VELPLQVNSAFQEIDFGDWEGKTAAQIDPQLLAQFYLDPVSFPPE